MLIFMLLVGILTIYDLVNWSSLSLVRKIVNVFAVLSVLHEIEEKYWPGGFLDLMLKKLKINIMDFDSQTAKLYVVILWLVYIFLGYVFDNIIFFVMMTVVLSIFEAFIHTVGIKIHKLSKPYTPGLVSAWLMAIVAIYAVIQFNKLNMIHPADYIIGFVLFVITFAMLAYQTFSLTGLNISETMGRIKE